MAIPKKDSPFPAPAEERIGSGDRGGPTGARVSARRRSTLRDRFLLAEDRMEVVHVEVVDGSDVAGTVVAVGADHVVVADGGRTCWVALQHVVAVRLPT